jgi:hypothetical protein
LRGVFEVEEGQSGVDDRGVDLGGGALVGEEEGEAEEVAEEPGEAAGGAEERGAGVVGEQRG